MDSPCDCPSLRANTVHSYVVASLRLKLFESTPKKQFDITNEYSRRPKQKSPVSLKRHKGVFDDARYNGAGIPDGSQPGGFP